MQPLLPAMSGPILKQKAITPSALENIDTKSDPGPSSPCKATLAITITIPSFALHRDLLMWLGWGSSVGDLLDAGLKMYEEKETNLPLATGESDVYESAGVCDSLLGAALGGLLLLLRLNLLRSPSAFVLRVSTISPTSIVAVSCCYRFSIDLHAPPSSSVPSLGLYIVPLVSET